MTKHIEYYEIGSGHYLDGKITVGQTQYYYMPVDKNYGDKIDIDFQSSRIWRLNIKTNERSCIKNDITLHPISNAEFLKIQLIAKAVPFNDLYNYRLKKSQRALAKK